MYVSSYYYTCVLSAQFATLREELSEERLGSEALARQVRLLSQRLTAYVSIRHHTSAYVTRMLGAPPLSTPHSIRQHTSDVC
jgi:hypothetical protein